MAMRCVAFATLAARRHAFPASLTQKSSLRCSSGAFVQEVTGGRTIAHGRIAPTTIMILVFFSILPWHRIVPVKETHSVELGWPLPEQHSHYLSKPVSYLSHLFGHEGSGSILSLLKVCCCGCAGTSYKCARLIDKMWCARVSPMNTPWPGVPAGEGLGAGPVRR